MKLRNAYVAPPAAGPNRSPGVEVVLFFSLAFGFSWLLWLPSLLDSLGMLGVGRMPRGLLETTRILGGIGPTLAAAWLTVRGTGWTGVRTLFRRTVRVQLGWWLVPALLALPFAALVGHLANHALTGAPIPQRPILSNPWMILVLLAVFWVMQFSEEPGWRGFALERLQIRWGPLAASLLVGLLWALWHLPMFLFPGFNQHEQRMPFLAFAVTLMLVSILMTWLQNGTQGSLVPAMVLHAWINTLGEVLPLVDAGTHKAGAWWMTNGVLFLIAVVVSMRVKPRSWTRGAS